MTTYKTALFATAITAILVAGALAIPDARADYRGSGNGGTLCKAASGPGAQVFYFDNRYAQNISASVQFLSCGFLDVYDYSPLSDATAINIGLANPTAASVTFTCVTQAGTDGFATTNSAVSTVSVPANTAFQNIFLSSSSTPAMPSRPSSFVGYTMSCAVPAQGKISMVEIQLPGSVDP